MSDFVFVPLHNRPHISMAEAEDIVDLVAERDGMRRIGPVTIKIPEPASVLINGVRTQLDPKAKTGDIVFLEAPVAEGP